MCMNKINKSINTLLVFATGFKEEDMQKAQVGISSVYHYHDIIHMFLIKNKKMVRRESL